MNDAELAGKDKLPIRTKKKTAIQENGVPGEKTAIQENGVPREKSAIQENGVPGVPGVSGWHSRGYLPHFDNTEATQHVTFHLADSLPKDVLARLEAEVRSLPVAKQDVKRRIKIEAWIDAGHGSCVLQDPVIAVMVRDSLLFFDGQRYQVLAWVVMPNHVHVLFTPINGWKVAKIVASWKKFTARKIRDHWRKAGNAGNANLLIGDGEPANRIGGRGRNNANREIGVPRGNNANREIGVPGRAAVWHREYWDRYMRDENHFWQAVEYIHQNPVKAGLVAKAEEWLWSSACAEEAELQQGKRKLARRKRAKR